MRYDFLDLFLERALRVPDVRSESSEWPSESENIEGIRKMSPLLTWRCLLETLKLLPSFLCC